MATRSQRRKEKQKQKRKEKKAQQRRRTGDSRSGGRLRTSTRSRHQQRVSRQKPEAWPGEMPEDVAVFDDAVRAQLDPDIGHQVLAVREALQLACDQRGADALQRVSGITRSSPLSDWRLFLRGLVAWLADDTDAAAEAWKRLNFDRRPGRMAIAMRNSLRTDLEHASADQNGQEAGDTGRGELSDRLDSQLLYHARLLRKVRFDRPAIRMAESGVRMRELTRDVLLGPEKLDWLRRFAAEYRDTEPDLVFALQQVALRRALAQPYCDLFTDAARFLDGPPHDPRNSLLSFFYYASFADDEAEALEEQALQRYLDEDLPTNERISEPLRAAIASQIHLEQARLEIQPPTRTMFSMFRPREDTKAIRRHLSAAIRACPTNRAAYRTHVDWVDSHLDNDQLTKPKREPYLKEKARVMTAWSAALPDDSKPRLWLVDYLMEREQMEDARPHVDWLAAARENNPLIRAAPWKWQLLEAMRRCRRKAWLKDVPAHLDEAERLWPAWLSRKWLAWLRCAFLLRAGKTDEFQRRRDEICRESGVERDSLLDACMMLGAAQLMRVPASDLKPLRFPVDEAVRTIRSRPDRELIDVSGFFWDLHRTKLVYPAYRMHGGKIVSQLYECLRMNSNWVLEHRDEDRVHSAILICSEHRCLSLNHELRLPGWYGRTAIRNHPMFCAAKLNAVSKLPSIWVEKQHLELSRQVREMANSQTDAYYRHWFVALADEVEERFASGPTAAFFGSGFNPFGFATDDGDDDDDDEDDDGDDLDATVDDWQVDSECDCELCRAERRAAEAARR